MGVEYTIMITDSQLNYVADPIVDWETIDVTLRFNEPSSGSFTVPAYQEIVDQLPRPASPGDPGVPERRVVIIRNLGEEYDGYTHTLIAGPIETWLREESDDGENSGIGKLTVHFADDLAHIVARSVYPNPAQTAAGQTVDRWSMTGVASTVLYALVNGNAGPGALPSRKVPMLTMAADTGIGGSVAVTAQRMEPLGDVARAIADTGGGLGFRTYQDSAIRFEVYQPPDKSSTVFFSFGLGNMKYRSVEVSAPTVTAAIVGGQGEGADRNLIERNNTGDEALWGRFEKLVSRPGSSVLQSLQDDGDGALGQGASTVRVTANVADIPDQRFGPHYQLGDRVSVETSPGRYIADVVVTVHIQVWNSAGEYVSPTVGSQAAKADPIWTQRLREIDDRLSRVERSVKPAVLPA